MTNWFDMKRKSFMFGSIKINVKVHKDKDFPKNESIMGLLTEMLGNPIVDEVPFYLDYVVHENLTTIELLVQSTVKKKIYDIKNQKNSMAMELLHMASDALEREGWLRVATDGDTKYLRYVYVIVG